MVEHHLAKVGVASSNLVFRSIKCRISEFRFRILAQKIKDKDRQLGKLEIVNPISEIKISRRSSGVEHFLGKEEVMGSNPINGSAFTELPIFAIG